MKYSFVLAILFTTFNILPFAEADEKLPSTLKESISLNDRALQALQDNDTEKAESLLRASVKTEPGNLTAVFNLTGVLVVNLKKDEALKILRDYTAKYPKDAGLLVRLGDITFSSENLRDSIKHYRDAYKIQPNYPRLAAKLGLVYALNQNITESENFLRKAVEFDPKDSEALTNLSSVLLKQGKVDKAREFAEKSLKLAPSIEAFITLGSSLEAKRDIVGALVAFKQAKELGSDSKDLEEKIQELSKLAK